MWPSLAHSSALQGLPVLSEPWGSSPAADTWEANRCGGEPQVPCSQEQGRWGQCEAEHHRWGCTECRCEASGWDTGSGGSDLLPVSPSPTACHSWVERAEMFPKSGASRSPDLTLSCEPSLAQAHW